MPERQWTRIAPALAAVNAAVKPVRITGVDLFAIDIPVTKEENEAGVYHQYIVARIDTDAGVHGYSFAGAPPSVLPQVQQLLVGKDLFGLDHLLTESLDRWGGVEHAIWDAIGKI